MVSGLPQRRPMPNRRPLFSGLVLLLCAVALGLATGRPGFAAAAPANEVTVVSAVFGAGKRTADVTARMTELVHPRSGKVVVDAKTLGADPAPGTGKELVVTYTYHGATCTLTIKAGGAFTYQTFVTNAASSAAAAAAAPAAVEAQILSADEMAGVVLIEGDKGVATGFLAQVRGSLQVVTNLHVIGDNDKITVRTLGGKVVATQGIVGAIGADIALLKVANPAGMPPPLVMAGDVLHAAKIGGKVVVVGNRLGGGVATQVTGQVKGIGPARVELDAPFQHGNSGSPILDATTKQVLGVAAYVSSMNAQFQGNGRRNGGGFQRETRWFGYRLDTVTQWENIDWPTWKAQTRKVNDFLETSQALFAAATGQFSAAKDADEHLRTVLAPYSAALDRIEKPGVRGPEKPAAADLAQIREMFHALGAYAAEGTREFAAATYYDYFRNGVYWESNVAQQADFRAELIKAFKNEESDAQ